MAEKKPAKHATQKSAKGIKASKGFTEDERAAMRERAHELKAVRSRAGVASEESAVLTKIAEMPAPDRAPGRTTPCHHQSQYTGPLAKALVRDASIREGRQGGLFLSRRAEIQDEVCYGWLQRPGGPRRRAHVAHGLRREGVDRRRRGEDQRAPEESSELIDASHFTHFLARRPECRASGAVDCGASVRQYERQCRRRAVYRRADGRSDRRAWQSSGSDGPPAHFELCTQGEESRRPNHRRHAARELRGRGHRATRPGAAEGSDSARRRTRRSRGVVGELRS